MEQLSVGIDVGSEKNDAFVMNPDGSKNRRFEFENSPEGTEKLIRHILEAARARAKGEDKVRVEIGMESTSVYADHLAIFLASDERLKPLDSKVYIINPTLIKAYKKALPENHKTDKYDAYVIADKVRTGNIGAPLDVSDEDLRYRSLRMMTRTRSHLVHELVQQKQRYGNLVYMKCSGLVQDSDIHIHSATILTIVDEFETVDALAYASHEQLVEVIKRAGKNKVQDPDAYADRVQNAAKRSYRLPKQLVGSVNVSLQAIVTSIKSLEDQVSLLDKRIAEELKTITTVLTSIPGIGPVYAAGIVSEIGDIDKYKNEAALAKYAGLAWKRNQSSKFESEDTRLFQTGNRYLRYYLTEAANSVRMRIPEYGNFYNLKCKEVNHNKHKRAITLTARKLVRLVFRLLKGNCLYKDRGN